MTMQLSKLKTGTRLEITWFSQTEPDIEHPSYVSQLLEPPEGNQLLIAMPIHEFRLINWPAAHRLQVTFVEQDSCVWTFTASLIERQEKDQIMAFLIQASNDLQRYQRRAWYRLPCSLDMTFRYLTPEDEPAEETQYRAVTRNISGGGAAFIPTQPLKSLTDIEMTLQLDDQDPIIARGQILRVVDITEKPPRKQVSLKFTDISQPNQEALVQFVFQQQLRLSRKK